MDNILIKAGEGDGEACLALAMNEFSAKNAVEGVRWLFNGIANNNSSCAIRMAKLFLSDADDSVVGLTSEIRKSMGLEVCLESGFKVITMGLEMTGMESADGLALLELSESHGSI